MRSYDVNLFEVGFDIVTDALACKGVDISWEEKERDKAMAAWQRWQQLTEADFDEIGKALLSGIEPHLRGVLNATLSSAAPREIRHVEVTIETNLGESRLYSFASIAEAVEFLENFDETLLLEDRSGPSLWEVGNAAPSQST